MKKYFLILLCFLLIGCTSQDNPKPTPTVSNAPTQIQKVAYTSFDAGFDTVFYLTFYSDKSETELKSIFNETVTFAYNYHKLFDIYNDYEGINNIKTINDNAGIEPVVVNDDIIEMLLVAKEMCEMSQGEFDVTYGSVFKVWHDYREIAKTQEKGPTPNKDELVQAAKTVGWDHVHIDEEKKTVYLDEGIRLDVGGIAKGFTTEKISEFLKLKGITSAIINFGGNNRVIGSKPDGTAWGLGIEKPGQAAAMVAVSSDTETSVVTSGDYHRYYVSEDGNTYHHIIDPQTLFPSTYFHSVTVFTKNSGYADALSTSLFTLSVEEGQNLLETFNQTYPDTPASAVWIMDESEAFDTEYSFKTNGYFVTYTSDLSNRIKY